MNWKLVIIVFTAHFLSINTVSGQVAVSKINDNWTLLVDGNPFEIRGATFGYDQDVENYDDYFKDLKSLGVNTIRTWATGENTPALLESANSNGIKVMMGIWMRHGRPGMEADDTFDYLKDKEGMESMYSNAKSVVQKYKDNPAVLTWTIGNEVYLNTATDEEKEAYSRLLERIVSEIKNIDANHPVASVEAWTFGIEWWEKLVPSLDIYGINTYGPGAGVLPGELEKIGVSKPYVITEFGVTGEWDLKEDQNGVILDPSDEQKYEAISKGYPDWIKSKPQCLGVYFFHYANGHEHMAPWLFTHFEGKKRPQYWAIREAYTGEKPINNPPQVISFNAPDGSNPSGSWIPVQLEVTDKENESLEIEFAYNQRTGSRKRRDQLLRLNSTGSLEDGFEIQLPKVDGPIKIYALVTDEFQNIGIKTFSTIVDDPELKGKTDLLPKVELPFYVYRDGEENPYVPSGLMGNYQAIKVDLNHSKEVKVGNSSLEVSYNSRKDWYGVALVDPANDWGDVLGGYDITGAKKFSFWAKANDTNVKAKIGFGLIDSDKPYPDSAKDLIEITVPTKWKYFSINIKKLDLSRIRSGLVLFSSSDGFPHKIYLDDVKFE